MMKLKASYGMLAIAMVVVMSAGSAMAYTCPSSLTSPLTPIPPAPGNFNFCGALNTVYCSLAPLGAALPSVPEIGQFAGLVVCDTADINGEPIEEEPFVQPNGILDGEYELGVIAAVLNDPFYSQNGLTHAMALNAFNNNYTLLVDTVTAALTEIGYIGLVNFAAPYLVNSLCYVLAGYAIIGDANSLAAMGSLIGLLEGLGIAGPSLDDFVTLGDWFAPNADPDGDGCTNRQEHDAYASQGAAVYVANTLNPEVFPEDCDLGPALPKISISGPGGMIEAGSALELIANVSTGTPLDYVWKKNGQVLDGEEGSSLIIDPVTVADTGNYRVSVQVETEEKAIDWYDSPNFYVAIVEAGSLPLAGGLGLGMLAGACALVGLAGIRRKK